MNKILVVGLAMVLAAAGNARADGANGQSSSSSATSGTAGAPSGSAGSSASAHSSGGGAAHSSGNGAVAPARSSGRGSVQQGAVAPRSGAVPAVRNYPGNVNVQSPVQANPNTNVRVYRQFLDRSEILARQAMYFNRMRVNPLQGSPQSTVNPGQVSAAGGQVDLPNQGVMRTRRHRDDENNSQNKTNGTNRTDGSNGTQTANGTQANKGRPMPATNTPPHSGRPVLNFNNSNTMSFSDACRRHQNHHDRDWWRNNCHTIILIGGGFYAWDLGYWYPAWGYDNYYSNYAYNGPIYGYDGLPPDQVIANVQYALQQLGYFSEAVDGVLGGVTQSAIEDYQVENDLPVTGGIDRPLLISLGFIR
jgi:hypothetical protein